jgi:hypothetical protein
MTFQRQDLEENIWKLEFDLSTYGKNRFDYNIQNTSNAT